MEIRKYLPSGLLKIIRILLHVSGRYCRKCYSQEGEDILFARFWADKKIGFYVDVGAHHPSRFSNTYYFYKRGWRGINIDATPGSMSIFNIVRHRDINLEIAVSDKPGTVEFHTFSEPGLNTFNKDVIKNRRKSLNEEATEHNVFNIAADTLESILNQHLPQDTQIDFLSIDVEGNELAVLKSNNWNKYRPKYIFAEILGESILSLSETEVAQYLKSVGYEPMSKLIHTTLFREVSLEKIKYI